MSNPSEKSDKVRVTVDMSQEMYNVLSMLADETHKSKADVLRLGLSIMKAAVPELRKGKKLGIAGKEEQLETQFLGIFN